MTGSAFEILLGAGRFCLRCSRRDLRLKIGEGPGGDRESCVGNPGKKEGKRGRRITGSASEILLGAGPFGFVAPAGI